MVFISKSASRVVLGVFSAGVIVAAVNAQSPGQPSPGVAPSEANHFIETPKGWVHPRTPWGDPDLTGVWPIAHGLNLVRSCPRGGGPGRGGPGGAPPAPAAAPAPTAPPCDPNNPPLFKTAEVYQADVERATGVRNATTQAIAALATGTGSLGAALQSSASDPTFPERQTSMIVDPPNGKLPELTAEGKRRAALMKSSWQTADETTEIPPPGSKQKLAIWDAPEDFDSWDRCITRGMPTSMMPYRYNNGINIIQAPGMVVLNLEMIHEDRIVYTDGRPPLKPVHKQYMGEPRGRWEGNTLVITTTNYKEGPSGTNIGVFGSPAGNRWPVSDQMRTTERLTRLNNDTILYEMKIEDPLIMAQPYTVRYPLRLNNSYEWWEYNCHEGNRTIRDYINGSRKQRGLPVGDTNTVPTR
ncbi:MAG TPA: hypothetical protein VM846_11125 [Vicinamibacterales bacterium]|nr:hypothetical protein [Vicinamibacterales bacterium]